MTTVAELIKQKEAIEAQIIAVQQAEHADAVSKAKAIVAEHGLTPQDVFGGTKAARKTSGNKVKVAAKYKDTVSGATWTGRGKAPKWIEGQDRAKFLIA
jgi:DNA-binding protein H-NS